MYTESKNSSKRVLAILLIVIGGLWMVRQLGLSISFPHFYFGEIFHSIRNVFQNVWHLVFSWPLILIIIGLVLLAGRRSKGGIILIVIGGLLMVPNIFFIHGVAATLLIPAVIIGIGVALIIRVL